MFVTAATSQSDTAPFQPALYSNTCCGDVGGLVAVRVPRACERWERWERQIVLGQADATRGMRKGEHAQTCT
jgi:hypothetical protein